MVRDTGGDKMIDIIIPVYNTPKEDLCRCLESIRKQSYSNYHVSIIDDGSCFEIASYLDEYCSSYSNFTVIHTDNHGVGAARNKGIEVTHSEYLTFVDADDTLEANFLEEALEILVTNDLDLVVGGYYGIKNDVIVKTRTCPPGFHLYEGEKLNLYFDKLLSGKLREDNQELGDIPTGRIYTKLYKRSVIQEVRFCENIRISEDTLFLIDLMKNVKRIGVVSNIWYNYYQNDYSIVHNEIDLVRYLDFIQQIYLRMLVEKNALIKNAYCMRIFKTVMNLVSSSNNLDILDLVMIKEALEQLSFDGYINVSLKEKNFLDKSIALY